MSGVDRQIDTLAGTLPEPPETSLFALGAILLRRRRWILVLGLAGAVIGALLGLLKSRQYTSEIVFVPQSSESSNTGLALAASQFGIRLPNSGSTWGPPIYVELLDSWSVLAAIAQDTVVIAEQGGRRVPLMDLLEVDPKPAATRTERAVRALRQIVTPSEDKKLDAVRLKVTTRWASVSLALVQHLVREVDRFNLETRKSQAGAERQFAEIQATEAESALRRSEDRMQQFLQMNRISSSPELTFQRDRLQRDIDLDQQIYTSLVQSREEARMREVRDTPTITVLEAPRLPELPEARHSALKAVLGGVLGGLLGIIFAFASHAFSDAKRSPTSDARDFFQLMDQVRPRFLSRGARRAEPDGS